MRKVKISAREITADIRAGSTNSALESKYNLSADGLQYVLRRLVDAGVLTQLELYERTPLTESDVMRAFSSEGQVFKCPVCGKTIPPQMDECPNCEVITQKFEDKFFIETLDIMSISETAEAIDDDDSEALKQDLFDFCRRREVDEVRRLLTSGFDVDVTLPDGTTPLMVAAQVGSEDLVELLLQFGAKLNASDNLGATALTWASRNGHRGTIRLLLIKGATVQNPSRGQGPSNGGNGPKNDTEIAARTVESKKTAADGSRLFEFVSGDLTIKANSRSKALLKACSRGRLDAVELLVKAGVHVDSRSKYGNTPLMRAAFKGHTTVAAFLLKMGADINAENTQGNTALMAAVLSDKKDMVEFLLARGANVNPSNVDSNYPLTVAAMSGNLRIAEILLNSGANVNAKNNDWDSPLMKATDVDHFGMVKLLLEQDVDVNAANKYGNSALMKAAYRGNADLVKLLLEKGADKDARNKYGITALMKACYKGHSEAAELLLQYGADPTLRDNEGKTAQTWAAMNASWEVDKLLRQYGLKTNR
ncbi:MAG: ankyrin repeat domain-containing protein [Desulfomonile tiedjei]|uniref:Ankyrin repeat domain-containing protein n=1 Tax=Desulfomonile tiedjei TaxID=2358 RepID=A0A9D6Z2S2_9BACT|nr:ankyrin repeat domain-containing protein [Desulfomonile tiedjei]